MASLCWLLRWTTWRTFDSNSKRILLRLNVDTELPSSRNLSLNSLLLWEINGGVVLLSVVNTVFWFYAIKQVGSPNITSLSFLLKLGFNPFFLCAISSALAISVVSYYVLYAIGIGAGRAFLTIGLVATIITSTVLSGQKPSNLEIVGFVVVIIGTLLISLGAS